MMLTGGKGIDRRGSPPPPPPLSRFNRHPLHSLAHLPPPKSIPLSFFLFSFKMGCEKSIPSIGAQLEKALPRDDSPGPSCPSNKPHARFQLRTLCLVGALLPGVGCYACLFYTFLFQQDRIRNFTTSNCPQVQSSFPPVSYSIGVWEPQKSFWLLVLFLHVPARLFFGIAYKAHFAVGESEYKQRKWYPRMVKGHLRLILVEIFGLIAVSIVDIQNHFVWHAIFYAVWLISFNFNMLFNTLLFHHSGIRSLRKPYLDRIFYLKCLLCYGVAYPLSMSTGLTYFGYLFTCSGLSYALFSLAEYIIVGLNSFWYFLLIWELDGCEMELYVRQ